MEKQDLAKDLIFLSKKAKKMSTMSILATGFLLARYQGGLRDIVNNVKSIDRMIEGSLIDESAKAMLIANAILKGLNSDSERQGDSQDDNDDDIKYSGSSGRRYSKYLNKKNSVF